MDIHIERKEQIIRASAFGDALIRNVQAVLKQSTSSRSLQSVKDNHLPDKENGRIRQMMTAVRERSLTETTPIPAIYREESLHLSMETAGAVNPPPFRSIHTSMYQIRHRNYPPLPKTIQDIILPEWMQQTPRGEEFVLHQDNIQGILIFGTMTNVEILTSREEIFVDGTFFVCPRLYYQLFTLHCFMYGKQVPLLYCLLDGKTTELYVQTFRVIRDVARKSNRVFNPSVYILIL